MKVREYGPSAGDGFRMASFYFYGRQQTHKLVLRFDRNTVTLSVRKTWKELHTKAVRYGEWQELKTWKARP